MSASRPIQEHLVPGRVLDLTCAMTRIPSFMKEKAVSDWTANTMEDMGFDEVWQQEVEPGRPNAFGRVRGTGHAPSILFNGHLDHNMVCEGWTRDPFDSQVVDGWVFGLGVANMKAGDMAMLSAVEAALRSDVRPPGDLIVEFVVGELQGGLGTKAALEAGVTADMFIDAEPTELGLLTMHAGVVCIDIRVHGEMRHYTTLSGRKKHAIEKAVSIMEALGPSYEPLAPEGWMTFEPAPAYAGLPRLNVGSIRGGMGPNAARWRTALVPDYCEFSIDMRVVPGQDTDTILADLDQLFDRLRDDDPDLVVEAVPQAAHGFFPPFAVAEDEPIVQAVARAHEQLSGAAPRIGGLEPTKYAGADSAHLSAAGMPGLLYGPGGRYLSVPDERVKADDVVLASRVFCSVIEQIWGIEDKSL